MDLGDCCDEQPNAEKLLQDQLIRLMKACCSHSQWDQNIDGNLRKRRKDVFTQLWAVFYYGGLSLSQENTGTDTFYILDLPLYNVLKNQEAELQFSLCFLNAYFKTKPVWESVKDSEQWVGVAAGSAC